MPKPKKSNKNRSVPQAKASGAGKRRARGKRWYFGADKIGFGPLSVENIGIGSGTRSRSIRAVRGEPDGSQGGMIVTNAPSHHGNTPMVIERREVIGTVGGNTGFASTQYQIQPGNSVLFPWLSQLANLYEKYKFRKLHFEYVNLGSGYATANVSGRVVLAVDYNVLSANLQNIADAEMKDPNVPFAPYEDAILRVDVGLATPKSLYTRGAAYPAGGDPKSYDAGMFYFVVNGTPNTANIGTLYVEYEVELYAPQLKEIAKPQTNYTVHQRFTPGPTPASGTEITLEFSNFAGIQTSGALPITYNAGTLTFPAGNYLVSMEVVLDNTTSSLGVAYMGYSYNGGVLVNMCQFQSSTNTLARIPLSTSFYQTFNEGDTLTPKVYAFYTGGVTTLFPTGHITIMLI